MESLGYLKRYTPLIRLAQKSVDIAVIFISLIIVGTLTQSDPLADSRLMTLGIFACVLFSFFAKAHGLYRSWRTLNLVSEFYLLCYTQLGVILGLLLIGYLTKTTADISREVFISWMVVTPIILLTIRAIVRLTLRTIRIKGFNSRRVAVLGHGLLAQQLVQDINTNEFMGMEVLGYYDDRKEPREQLEQHRDEVATDGFNILGGFSEAIADAKARAFDELYIALPMRAEQKISELISKLSDCAVNVHLVPDLLTFNLINSQSSVVGGSPVVSIYKSPLDDQKMLVKNCEDFLLSALILSLITLPMLVIALGIKLTSKGPVLFKQRRYGMGGEEIMVWKFRTMTVTEDGDVVTQATKNDARVTSFGRFLRKTSLDELPQFINVLQGQMSIVGPRPHAVSHNELYRKVIDRYMLRHLVKPGITGWAQINGWRGETDSDDKMKKRIEYDLHYIKNWSLRLDLKIIFLTIFKGFTNNNAY